MSAPELQISGFKYLFFVACFAMQGYMVPFSIFFFIKTKGFESVICFIGSLIALISSFTVLVVLPDIKYNLNFSDFKNGYLPITSDTKPYQFLVIVGFGMFVIGISLKLLRLLYCNYQRKNRHGNKETSS